MAEFLVLVNGLPGSGKTTLGRSLAAALGAEFLSKDTVKEAMADCVADADVIHELGGIAMDAVWALARATPGTVVIDSWWFKPRDLSFAATGIDKSGADRVVEVWCDIPAELAKARYADRRRAAIHRDEQRLVSDWAVWAAQAAPLDLAPTVRVDTARPVCGAEVAVEVERVAVRWARR